jgi:positive regulator of sigma E activity
MRHQDKIRLQRRNRRKFFWLFAAAAVSALLFAEQIALLFVLATFAMVGLLIVVAFSNLEARDAGMQAAAIREATYDMTTKSRDLSRCGRQAA